MDRYQPLPDAAGWAAFWAAFHDGFPVSTCWPEGWREALSRDAHMDAEAEPG